MGFFVAVQWLPIVGEGMLGWHAPHPILPPALPVYCLPNPPIRPRIVAAVVRRPAAADGRLGEDLVVDSF
jgi:hypothetical protein